MSPEPIPLAGTWEVTDFTLEAGDVDTAVGLFDSETFMFEPTSTDCVEPGCDMTLVNGPGAAVGAVMTADSTFDGGFRYESSDLALVYSCAGAAAPSDIVDSRLVVTQGTGDTLSFEVVVDADAWGGCDAASVTYDATANRSSS